MDDVTKWALKAWLRDVTLMAIILVPLITFFLRSEVGARAYGQVKRWEATTPELKGKISWAMENNEISKWEYKKIEAEFQSLLRQKMKNKINGDDR